MEIDGRRGRKRTIEIKTSGGGRRLFRVSVTDVGATGEVGLGEERPIHVRT